MNNPIEVLTENPHPTTLTGSLIPYSGPWTEKEAAHLLRRTTFGPTKDMIVKAQSQGLQATLQELLNVKLPTPPLNYSATNDPEVPIGSSWIPPVDQSPANGINPYRYNSITAWFIWKLQSTEISILEKMVLFWHNHFVVSDIESPALFWLYFDLIQKNALGSYKELAKEMCINPAMLRYLNNNLNTINTPNENFARELLELFTIGKGPLVGPGDYTNYTEQDVRALTKALSGWNYRGEPVADPKIIAPYYTDANHDKSTKNLSNRFIDPVIVNQGDKEYIDVIEKIFKQEECSRYIAREIYKWFVNYHITPEVELDVIEQMAAIIRVDDYKVEKAVLALLESDHFYSEEAYGCMIKSPLDFIMSISNGLKFPVPKIDNSNKTVFESTINDHYSYFRYLWMETRLMGQVVSEIPQVAGWKAYYQEPLFYRHWINSVTLQERKKWVLNFVKNGIKINNLALRKIPVLQIIGELDNPKNIDPMLTELISLLLPYPLTKAQFDTAKSTLLNGLPDYEWTLEYEEYLMDPNNTQIKNALEAKVQQLFLYLMNLPEFLLH